MFENVFKMLFLEMLKNVGKHIEMLFLQVLETAGKKNMLNDGQHLK